MVYKFKVNDNLYNKLLKYSEDQSIKHNEKLAGNIINEFSLEKYIKEIEPLLFEHLLVIEPLQKYLKKLDILSPKGLPITLSSLWVNHQKKYEFNPFHNHSGVFSFIIFLKIPYTMQEQELVSPGKNSNNNQSGKVSFFYLDSDRKGSINEETLPVDNSWEGTGVFFKSSFNHCVYPFYTEGTRITVSGNIHFNSKHD
jgi:hypothetical protein